MQTTVAKNKVSIKKTLFRRTAPPAVLLAGLALLSGCGGSSGNSQSATPSTSGGVPTTNLQSPSAAVAVNNYVGTQSSNLGASVLSGGDWGLVVDSTGKTVSYQNPSSESVLGLILYDAGNSFYSTPPPGPLLAAYDPSGTGWLGLQGGATIPGSNGYALEIPGRGALLRPGDATHGLVVAAQTSECLNLAGQITFQFIALGSPFTGDTTPHVAYGSVQVSTTPTAASSSGTQPGYAGIVSHFTSLKMSAMDGTTITPPPIPDGVCGQTQMGFAISIPQPTGSPLAAQTAAIGPSGLFTLDQAQGSPYLITGDPNINYPQAGAQITLPGPSGPLGLVGVIQPTAAVDMAKLVSGKYLGFATSAPLATTANPATTPIAMEPASQPAPGGNELSGGDYPNDDVTQPVNSDIAIELGDQDSASAGLFNAVTVTLPDYSYLPVAYVNSGKIPLCAGQPFGGTDSAGNLTCVFHGVAIVGQPEGKYVIFITVSDPSLPALGLNFTSLATRQFVLYEQ